MVEELRLFLNDPLASVRTGHFWFISNLTFLRRNLFLVVVGNLLEYAF